MITLIILLILSGLIVGALARLALPGPDPMSIPETIGVGLAGSFVGGLIMRALTHSNGGSVLVSVLVATFFVYLLRRHRTGQGVTSNRF